jgi:tRNA(Ile)-lysidine synthase
MPSEPFLVRLERAAAALLRPHEAVCVGFSGGGDSTALLHGLVELSAGAGPKRVLHVAHLNHRLRPDADADEAFCRDVAARLGQPISVERLEVAALAAARGQSLERTARDERYRFFEIVARQSGCAAVAVAHHADDNAETILHRIGRGTGLRGLAGIPADRPIASGSPIRLVRPLLSFRRQDLRAYLAERGLKYRTDPSNELPIYTRNRIRMEALPALAAAAGRDPVPALLRLAKAARRAERFVAAHADSTEWTCLRKDGPGRVEIDRERLAMQPLPVRLELLRRAWVAAAGAEGDVEQQHLERLLDLADSPAGGRTVELPAGVRAERDGATVTITAAEPGGGAPPPGE